MDFNYRKYPGRYLKPPRGICRWCKIVIRNPDGVTVNRKKTFCSSVCYTHYLLRADPQKMRQNVFFRDKGVCSACGYQHVFLFGDWENDHIKPLMLAFGDPSFWEPENCQILCKTPCHKIKSSEDRRRYRKKDRDRVKQKYLDLISME